MLIRAIAKPVANRHLGRNSVLHCRSLLGSGPDKRVTLQTFRLPTIAHHRLLRLRANRSLLGARNMDDLVASIPKVATWAPAGTGAGECDPTLSWRHQRAPRRQRVAQRRDANR